MGSDWVWDDGQAGPYMGLCMGDAWVGILPGLVMLDLGVGGGLDDDGGEMVDVVSCEMENHLYTDPCITHAKPMQGPACRHPRPQSDPT